MNADIKAEHEDAFLAGSAVGILLHGSISCNVRSVLYQRTVQKSKQKSATVHYKLISE